MEKHLEALWKTWRQHSDDPAHTGVLSDALSIVEDPGGELLALEEALRRAPSERIRLAHHVRLARHLRNELRRRGSWLDYDIWRGFELPEWRLEIRAGRPFGVVIGRCPFGTRRGAIASRLFSGEAGRSLQWLQIDARETGGIDDVIDALRSLPPGERPLRKLVVGRLSRRGRPTVHHVDVAPLLEAFPALEELEIHTRAPAIRTPRKAPMKVLRRLAIGGEDSIVLASLGALQNRSIVAAELDLAISELTTADEVQWARKSDSYLRARLVRVRGCARGFLLDGVLRSSPTVEHLELDELSCDALEVLDRVSIPADLRFVRLGSRGVGHRRRHALEEKFGPRLCWR